MDRDHKLLNELVIQGTRIGVWDWNVQTGETFFNERWAEIIGYTIEELQPISIETWIKYAHPEDLEESNRLLELHFKGETEYYDFQSRMKHKNGHWIWVHDRGKVFEWDSENKPLRMCGSHIEITKDKELEIELKKAIGERDILLKEVHHRVKNNLQLLLSISRLKSKNGKIDTHEIEDSINSISGAFEAIYRSERIDEISVQNYLAQIIQPLISGLTIVLDLNAPNSYESIDFLIPLGLIITELVNNSIKHAFKDIEKRKIHITIKDERDCIVIQYGDNGRGYDLQLLKQPQYLNSFGLNIISGLVDQLNGTIKFENHDGAYAEITLNLH